MPLSQKIKIGGCHWMQKLNDTKKNPLNQLFDKKSKN